MNFFPEKYWTIDELTKLVQAVKESDGGAKSVWWNGRYGRFVNTPSYTFRGDGRITVADLDFEYLVPPKDDVDGLGERIEQMRAFFGRPPLEPPR